MGAAAAPHPSRSILEIDLRAIVANWRALGARLAQGATCAGVVKADAYGLGAAQVAPALAQAGCTEFFVAHLEEALALRPLLPETAYLHVLNGCLPGEERIFVAAGLVPVLNDPGQVVNWATQARRLGHPLPAALHLDTGMSRLGLTPREAQTLAAQGEASAPIDLRLVMSHLARAEEACAMNGEQLARFAVLRARWPAARASLANSSGIFLGAPFHFDLARPGAALYGINPVPGRPNPQLAVVRLTAPVLQIRDIAPPETIGYGATFQAPAAMRIATLACGYADGWPRSLSNSGTVHHEGLSLPILGRVSMDTIVVDATTAPGLRVGNRVELLGSTIGVDQVADAAGTNGYEVLTRLGRRFSRVYAAA
jgi:alanine racemase